MIGFSFFMFEGIGTVMPVMNACDKTAKKRFPWLIIAALGSLCTLYILFSELCYLTYGDGLQESIVLEQLPKDNGIIIGIKVLFSLNILFTYPITIYPTNLIIDSFLFGHSHEDHHEPSELPAPPVTKSVYWL
jgi:amino acid permease